MKYVWFAAVFANILAVAYNLYLGFTVSAIICGLILVWLFSSHPWNDSNDGT